jgi:hypothetical protein
MQSHARKPHLHELEQADNLMVLDGIALNAFPNSLQDATKQQQIEQVKRFIAAFTQENVITLLELTDDEREALRVIWAKSLQGLESEQIERDLYVWKKSLKLAVAGQGEHVAIAAAQERGMSADLIQAGVVAPGKWGTDLDIRHCLGADMTDPLDICAEGGYILPPEDLTASAEALAKTISLVLERLRGAKVQEKVWLSIPVCCRNQHWCLVKIEINQYHIVAATLWDSKTQYSSSLRATREFENFSAAIHQHAKELLVLAECPGVQENGFSCMDYVLQQAYIFAGFTPNDLTAAETEDNLRIAVIMRVAANLPSLGMKIANKYNEIIEDSIVFKTKEDLNQLLQEALQVTRENDRRHRLDFFMR